MVFQAARGRDPVAERSDFASAALAQSPLPGAEPVAGPRAADRNQAPRSLVVAVPDDAPSVAMIDEVRPVCRPAPAPRHRAGVTPGRRVTRPPVGPPRLAHRLV
ncbi:hypothetical protein [Streptomyces iranensis]|uniref:hypothetical protein n=1 Tax=Streptomyces iranensis TaxID=576784 RepID=UPI0039B73A09